ncbi:9060_t:CDS:2 [Acaulospora morrowiae]|uniref:9060_t:CDS:1 n=1 Tax=Acaulospora morrowiae TaxID=94023 RepID=A0A9N8Z7J3_9GLOM|nr:9060_t:CDS:2 [Acaulospora morrowiae]
MADIDIMDYVPTIKNILMNSVHSEITARDVRLKLEQEFKVDLTSRKHEVQQLVEQCFDALEMSDEEETGDSEQEQVKVKVQKSKKHVHAEERRHKSSAKSHEKGKSKSKKMTKSRAKSSVSDYSSLEDDKPQKRKRGRKRKNSLVDSDAEYERRFEEELNGKKTKSKSNGSSKKKPSHKRRKKDDDDEGNEEKKKRRGITGIHKPLVLSPVLSRFLNAEELSRLEVVKRLWVYIKENDLQDPNDKRYIVCDEKLMTIFKHERIHSFTMNKYLTDHLKKKEDLVTKAEQGNSSSINGDDHDYAFNDDHSEGVGVKYEAPDETRDNFDDDHSEEIEVKTEAPDEVQYKFDDDHSEGVDANTGEFEDDDDEEWVQ